MTDFPPQEMAEIETLTLTKKIARGLKGALTAKQLGEMLSVSPKTIFKLARAGRIPSFQALRNGELFCLQRRMASSAFSVGAVAFGAFGCIDFFACIQGLRSRGDRILAGTSALWNLLLPMRTARTLEVRKEAMTMTLSILLALLYGLCFLH